MRFLRLIQLELFGPFKEPTGLVQCGMLFTFDKIDMKRASLSVLLSLIRELVSELTGQTIPVIIRISLLIKTIKPDR